MSSEQSDELLAAEGRSEPLCLGYARVSTLEQNISQKAATAALGRPRSRASPDVGEGALPQVRAADQISSRLTVEGCVAARFGRRDTDWARRRVACSAWLWLRADRERRRAGPGPYHCQPFRVQVHGRRHLTSARDRG